MVCQTCERDVDTLRYCTLAHFVQMKFTSGAKRLSVTMFGLCKSEEERTNTLPLCILYENPSGQPEYSFQASPSLTQELLLL